MDTLRKPKEIYTDLYPKALELDRQGMDIKDIARTLGVSYSAVYAWIKQKRVPAEPALVKFHKYLQQHGPTAAIDIKDVVPKHDDFYHIALRRGMGIKRVMLDRRYREYRVWYYLEGQESALEDRLNELRKKYEIVKERLLKTLGA